MLVLSRRDQQEILIGEDIRIQVVAIRGAVVKIGIDAPQSMTIKRKELLEEEKKKKNE